MRERRGKPSPEPSAYGLQVRHKQCQREDFSVDTFLPPPLPHFPGHFRWEVLPNVLACRWGFKWRTGSCSVMKPLQLMGTQKKRGKKKKKQRKEEKRKHNLACVKKQSAESAENLSTPCLALVLSSCSPSPTKGIRHCPPLKHTLLLFRTTFFLKGSHQIVEQKRQCGAHSHTLWDYKYQTWFDLNERWVCILPLLPHSLN